MSTRKTATVRTRIEPELKRDADTVLEKIGLSQSDFLTMAYKQLVSRRGLPFTAETKKTEDDQAKRKERIEKALEAIRNTRNWAARGGENSTDFIRRMRRAMDSRPIEVLEGKKVDRP